MSIKDHIDRMTLPRGELLETENAYWKSSNRLSNLRVKYRQLDAGGLAAIRQYLTKSVKRAVRKAVKEHLSPGPFMWSVGSVVKLEPRRLGPRPGEGPGGFVCSDAVHHLEVEIKVVLVCPHKDSEDRSVVPNEQTVLKLTKPCADWDELRQFAAKAREMAAAFIAVQA